MAKNSKEEAVDASKPFLTSRPFRSHRKPTDTGEDARHMRQQSVREPSRCTTCLRGIMSCYNVLVLLVGLGGLGVGLWLLLKEFNAREVTALVGVQLYEVGAYLLIAGGGVVALLAFCGCCGTMREDRCVLGFYAITLLLILFALTAGCALAFIFKNELGDAMKGHLTKTVLTVYGVDVRAKPYNRLVTDAWDSMQREYHCCGAYGDINSTHSWAVYKNSKWYQSRNVRVPYVPESCCTGEEVPLCTGAKDFAGPPSSGPAVPYLPGDKANPHLFTNGCYEMMVENLKEHATVIGIVASAIPVFLLVGTIIAFCLCVRVKKHTDEDEYEL